MSLSWDEGVLDYLTEKSFSITYGARNLRRTIQKDIEDQAAQLLLESYEHPLSQLAIRRDGDKLTVTGA